jgi:hypothetical protein
MTVRGPAPVLALCRRLIEFGHDPATSLEASRGDVLCLQVRSIGHGAKLTIEDNRLGQPRFRRWRDRHAGDGAASFVRQNQAAGTAIAAATQSDAPPPRSPLGIKGGTAPNSTLRKSAHKHASA